MNDKRLRWSRRLSVVPRWSVLPTVKSQNVAEHSFQVAQTVRWLLGFHIDGCKDPGFQMACINAALDHDLEEAAEGDAPSPQRPKANPEQAGQKTVVIKCADILEALAFIQDERLMGNQHGVDEVDAYMRAELHGWWQVFGYNGVKPITSDLVKSYLSVLVPRQGTMHPVFEGGLD